MNTAEITLLSTEAQIYGSSSTQEATAGTRGLHILGQEEPRSAWCDGIGAQRIAAIAMIYEKSRCIVRAFES